MTCKIQLHCRNQLGLNLQDRKSIYIHFGEPLDGWLLSEKRTRPCKPCINAPNVLKKCMILRGGSMLFKSTLHYTHCTPANTTNQIYFQAVKRFPEVGSLTHGRPRGKHDRMRRGYFKTGAVSGAPRKQRHHIGQISGTLRGTINSHLHHWVELVLCWASSTAHELQLMIILLLRLNFISDSGSGETNT